MGQDAKLPRGRTQVNVAGYDGDGAGSDTEIGRIRFVNCPPVGFIKARKINRKRGGSWV